VSNPNWLARIRIEWAEILWLWRDAILVLVGAIVLIVLLIAGVFWVTR
jgi:hypothetical protein